MIDPPTPSIADLIASRRRSTARRRYQTGQLIDDKDRWCARWREDVRRSDGTVKRVRKWDVLAMKRDCPTRRLAQRLLDEKLREINSDNYKPATVDTFAGFADRWMATILVQYEPSTQHTEKRDIEKQLKPVFGQFPMRDISAEAIQAWVSGSKYSPKTIKNYKDLFQRMWKKAKLWGYVTHDPFEGLRLAKITRGNAYRFSAEEMMAIIDEAKGWYSVFFELLAKTGMRPGEAAGLRPGDVEGRVIHVRQSVWRGKVKATLKTADSARDFAISDQLAGKIRKHIEEAGPNRHGLVFVNKDGNPLEMSHFNDKILRPILERLGIWEKIQASGLRAGNYAFRHGNMTELSRSGVPIKTIQARVGHSAGSDVTMRHYIHAVNQDDVQAADYMEKLLNPKAEGEQVQ